MKSGSYNSEEQLFIKENLQLKNKELALVMDRSEASIRNFLNHAS